MRVGDEVHQRVERERDGPVEVQDSRVLDGAHQGVGVGGVGLDVGRTALRRTAHEAFGVLEDEGVVVGVHDAGLGHHGLGDLVQVGLGRDARADVEPLADAVLLSQHTGGPLHERPVLAGGQVETGVCLGRDQGGFLVDFEVVLAAEEVVVHPGRVRPARVEIPAGLAGGHVLPFICVSVGPERGYGTGVAASSAHPRVIRRPGGRPVPP